MPWWLTPHKKLREGRITKVSSTSPKKAPSTPQSGKKPRVPEKDSTFHKSPTKKKKSLPRLNGPRVEVAPICEEHTGVFFGPVSNVYISSANNEEIKFSIHNAALRKSVVFAEELEEGKDLEIEQFGSAKVPASQNQLYFSKVVTCLYTNTFCDDGVERTPRELATAYTRLYLIGCSYDIPCLMQAALRKLRSIRDYLKQDPLILLEIAELAYSTRVMKSGFRTFFVTNANCVVDSDDRAVKDYVRRLVVRGGDLASSIFEAQHNWREELLSNHEDLRESLRSHPVNVPGAFSEASQATWEQ